MKQSLSPELKERIGRAGIIAVLVIDDPGQALPLAEVLLDNGITAMELTFRTEQAGESLGRIRRGCPEMLAGAGTIITRENVSSALAAGAEFGVAPGFNPVVAECAVSEGLPFAPGVSTPSEIECAVGAGFRILKFFHAEGMGGVSYLKGIDGPYRHLGLQYIPLGGLTLENIRPYLEMPEIIAIGGSWIAPRDLIRKGDWAAVGRHAAAAFKLVQEVRG